MPDDFEYISRSRLEYRDDYRNAYLGEVAEPVVYGRDSYKATVEGRIVGVGKTIRIRSMHVHYNLTVPPDAVEATERALAVHVQGCPAHQSVKDAIHITWAATLRAGDRTLTVQEESHAPSN